ncbi:signal-regulatory protein beta-2-like [Channa argus]|uniref:signal-regulatory protein beta-2-like n=1 Tax=Channa argus TaxID=215402 RepID=UPI003520546E
MLIVFYSLLMIRVVRCADEQTFVTKSVSVGENVILTCNLQKSGDIETFFWIKLVAGGLPEILGRAYSFLYNYEKIISRITTTQEPERFVLNITKTKPSDAGFYYCLKIHGFNITFLKGAFLSITGPEPDVTAIIQNFASDALYPGDLVTLQCSVLFDSGKKTCPEEHSVYWFRVGSDESHPNVIYTRGKSSDPCKNSPEARSPQKCVYSFSKNLSSSDSGTYYCAVATCGQILFGNGTKLGIEDVSPCDSKKSNTILVLLCVALAISLIVIAFLIYAVVKPSCYCCNAAAKMQTNAVTFGGNQQCQKRNEDLVYCTAVFTRQKGGKAERRNATAKDETIYSDVRNIVMNNPNSEFNH